VFHSLAAACFVQGAQERMVPRLTDTIEVNLGFRERAGHFVQLGARGFSRDQAREILDLLRQPGIGKNRDAEPVAARVAGCARLARLGTWARA
jgi:hypothetical protein